MYVLLYKIFIENHEYMNNLNQILLEYSNIYIILEFNWKKIRIVQCYNKKYIYKNI